MWPISLSQNKEGNPVIIELMDFASELELADDGCMVETGGPHSAHVLRSWMHDTGKSASRFDGDYNTGTRHGAFIGNVAWNISGFMVKGDQHNVSFNTVFDGSDIGSSKAPRSRPALQTPASALTNVSYPSIKIGTWSSPKANQQTVFEGNLVDGVGTKTGHWDIGKNTMAGKYNCTGDPKARVQEFTGIYPDCPVHGRFSSNNVVGSWLEVREHKTYSVKQQLRDPWNRDFRPCPHSLAAQRGAGAYKVWSPQDTECWIPGAMSRQGASQPSPRHGATDVAVDADLIFLGAFRSVGHTVLVAEGGQSGHFVPLTPTLRGQENVAHVHLKANTAYAWRVDAEMSDASVLKGETWTFSTGNRLSCP